MAKTVGWTFASLPFLVFLKNSRDKTGRGILSSLPYLLWQQWQEEAWQRQQQENGVPLSVAALPLPSLGCAPACYIDPGFLAHRQVFFFLSASYHFYPLLLAHRIGTVIVSKGMFSFNIYNFRLEHIIFAMKGSGRIYFIFPGRA